MELYTSARKQLIKLINVKELRIAMIAGKITGLWRRQNERREDTRPNAGSSLSADKEGKGMESNCYNGGYTYHFGIAGVHTGADCFP